MKIATILALVAAGSAPMMAGTAVEWLQSADIERVLHGENVTSVAAEIAQREFSANASIDIMLVETGTSIRDDWGGKHRAVRGELYYFVHVKMTNTGRLEIPISNHHFVAIDDMGRTHRSIFTDESDFDISRLRGGASALGTVVFNLPDYVRLEKVVWEGDIATSSVIYDGTPHPRE